MLRLVRYSLLGLLPGLAAGQQMTLEYRGRYNAQPGADHLMTAVGLSGNRALVAGNRGIALVDLKSLPVHGTRRYLFRLTGVDARDLYPTPDEKYVFVNLNRSSGSTATEAGFAVVKIQGNTLQKITTRQEPRVLYEKMCLAGRYLYVAAHAHGIRVYDVADPEKPVLAGSLPAGFADAFAIAVDGNRAWVADGGGGLKIVDVTNKARPVLTGGETVATAAGTYEDVSARNGRVYAAAGGAGLAVYEAGKLGSRTIYPVRGAVESLTWIGSYLASGTIAGVTVFAVGQGTAVTPVAAEVAHRRGARPALRLVNGVGTGSPNLLLAADWDFMDVYELKPAAASGQPDIDCSVQRIRFAPAGGTRRVTVTNGGQGTLRISSVSVTSPAFRAGYAGGTLAPGQSADFDITYLGGSISQGSGVVLIASNDPDENPLPIQVFGNTSYLDPGEKAPDFTLQTLQRDPRTGQMVPGKPFTLSQHRGKIVWLFVYGSW